MLFHSLLMLVWFWSCSQRRTSVGQKHQLPLSVLSVCPVNALNMQCSEGVCCGRVTRELELEGSSSYLIHLFIQRKGYAESGCLGPFPTKFEVSVRMAIAQSSHTPFKARYLHSDTLPTHTSQTFLLCDLLALDRKSPAPTIYWEYSKDKAAL